MRSRNSEALGLQPGDEEETQLDLVKAARKAEKKGATKAGMTFAERIDSAGGSAPQADSLVTKQLERLKRGIAVPDWAKDLPADQQEKVLSDRWSRLERVAPSRAKMNDRAARSVVEKELNGWSRSWAKFRHGEADGPTAVKPKPAAKAKMSFEQKMDIPGGSADQRKDPLTQLLAKHKIGLTVPTWTKSLDKSERDEILADRWEMLQNCASRNLTV